LITWLLFAAYLHARYSRGWSGNKAAVLGIIGFMLVLITYVGVDFFIPRQHGFLMWESE
jgi:ABC-type transport system involved in cytochrome c biogenesis permease subunit